MASAGSTPEADRRLTLASWAADPSLELVVECGSDEVWLSLAGTLDAQTGADVRGVVEELLAEGRRLLRFDVARLADLDAGGLAALVEIERTVHRVGAVSVWMGGAQDVERRVARGRHPSGHAPWGAPLRPAS